MTELRLLETIHPAREGTKEFEGLFGIDPIKEALVDELALILDRNRLETWTQRHHAKGLGVLDVARSTLPLILLSGDVGCGKTALASCVATPVARAIDQRIVCLETPSDIRGGGHVGELSARITEALRRPRRAQPPSGAPSWSSTKRTISRPVAARCTRTTRTAPASTC
jgi:SpoVK/Ycf46/Vps4 family AAA+-type ATPase